MEKTIKKVLAILLVFVMLITLCSCSILGKNNQGGNNIIGGIFEFVKTGEDLAYFNGIEDNIRYVADGDNDIGYEDIGTWEFESYGVDGKAEIRIAFDKGYSHKVGKYELKNIEGEYSSTLVIYNDDIEIGDINYDIWADEEQVDSYERYQSTYYVVSQGDEYVLEAKISINDEFLEEYEDLDGDFAKNMVVPELPKFLEDDRMLTSDNIKLLVQQAQQWKAEEEEQPYEIIEYYYEEYDYAMVIAIYRTEKGFYAPLRIIPVLKSDGTLGIHKIQEIWVDRDTPEETVEILQEQLVLYPLEVK